jgi:hypothetical protein
VLCCELLRQRLAGPLPGDRAAATPVIHQRSAEDILADALNDQPFSPSRLRQGGGLPTKPNKWGIGEADAKLVSAVDRGMESSQSVEAEGSEAGPIDGCR